MSSVRAHEELQEEERELLEQVASTVVRRRLAVPAMMFLEMSTPMNLLGSSALHMASPLWRAVVPHSRIDRVAALLEKRAAIPALIDAIDDAEARFRAGEADAAGAAPPDRAPGAAAAREHASAAPPAEPSRAAPPPTDRPAPPDETRP